MIIRNARPPVTLSHVVMMVFMSTMASGMASSTSAYDDLNDTSSTTCAPTVPLVIARIPADTSLLSPVYSMADALSCALVRAINYTVIYNKSQTGAAFTGDDSQNVLGNGLVSLIVILSLSVLFVIVMFIYAIVYCACVRVDQSIYRQQNDDTVSTLKHQCIAPLLALLLVFLLMLAIIMAFYYTSMAREYATITSTPAYLLTNIVQLREFTSQSIDDILCAVRTGVASLLQSVNMQVQHTMDHLQKLFNDTVKNTTVQAMNINQQLSTSNTTLNEAANVMVTNKFTIEAFRTQMIDAIEQLNMTDAITQQYNKIVQDDVLQLSASTVTLQTMRTALNTPKIRSAAADLNKFAARMDTAMARAFDAATDAMSLDSGSGRIQQTVGSALGDMYDAVHTGLLERTLLPAFDSATLWILATMSSSSGTASMAAVYWCLCAVLITLPLIVCLVCALCAWCVDACAQRDVTDSYGVAVVDPVGVRVARIMYKIVHWTILLCTPLLVALAFVFFIVGAFAAAACRPLFDDAHMEVYDVLSNVLADNAPNIKQMIPIDLKHTILVCQANGNLIDALRLNDSQQLTKIKNEMVQFTSGVNAQSIVATINDQLAGVAIGDDLLTLSTTVNQQRQQIATSDLYKNGPLNKTKLQMIDVLMLSAANHQLTSAQNKTAAEMMQLYSEMMSEINTITPLMDEIVKSVEAMMASVHYFEAISNSTAPNTLIIAVEKAVDTFKTYFDNALPFIINVARNVTGGCGALQPLRENINEFMCHQMLQPIQLMWLCLALAIALLVPVSIIIVLLVRRIGEPRSLLPERFTQIFTHRSNLITAFPVSSKPQSMAY